MELGILCDHLVHFVFIWYIFSGFGIMYQEKSGNPLCGPGLPDWVNFRLLGDSLLWALFYIKEVSQIYDYFFTNKNYICIY
jgi:hypothetical protein